MKKLRLIMLLCFLLALPTNLLATEPSLSLGTLIKDTTTVNYQGISLEVYKAFDSLYIPVSTLRSLGHTITLTPDCSRVDILPSTSSTTTPSALNLKNKSFALYSGTVNLNGLDTHALMSDDRILIPLGALRQFYDITITENTYTLSPKATFPISANLKTISNNTPYDLEITISDLYWKNEFIYKNSTHTIPAYSTLERPTIAEDNTSIYITTLAKKGISDTITYTNSSTYGQTNTELFKKYYKLKYTVTLTEYGDPLDSELLTWAESTVNAKGLSSSTQYLVWTNIDKQKTFIFTGSKDNWTLLKHFVCSTGKNSTPTPKGTYKLTYKVPSFGQDHGYCCKNAFGFIGTTYLYHSILFDKTGTYLLEGRGVLGKKASDGCIRLSPENAKWFYDNLKSQTTVWIN